MTTFGNLDINAPTFEELKGGKYLRNIAMMDKKPKTMAQRGL